MQIPSKRSIPLALILACSSAAHLRAATVTWNATPQDGNFSNPNNWVGGLPNGNIIVFPDSTTITNLVDDIPDLQVAGIKFGNTSITIGGNNPLTILPSTSSIAIPNAGNVTAGEFVTDTVNAPIVFAAGYHHVSNVLGTPPATLSFLGGFSRQIGSVVDFDGVVAAGPGLANTNGILGGWANTFAGWATLDSNGNITRFTNYVRSNQGVDLSTSTYLNSNLELEDNMSASGSPVIDVNSIYADNNGGTISIGANSTLRMGSLGGIQSDSTLKIGQTVGIGTLTAGGAPNVPGELFLVDAISSNPQPANLTINSVISDNGNGIVTVTINGSTALQAANTYTGGTFIDKGVAQVGNIKSFGTGTVTVFPGCEASLAAIGNYANDFVIAGQGLNATTNAGALFLASGSSISGNITLSANSSISGAIAITGKITGPGGIAFESSGTSAGNQTVTLGNGPATTPYDYQGDTTINPTAQGNTTVVILANSNNIMPSGIHAGNLVLNGNNAHGSIFDLNGTAQTINGITGGNLTQIIGGQGSVLTVGAGDISTTFGGSISSAISLVKIGAGTFTLTGPNTYTGNTTIENGSITVEPAPLGGNLSVGNATIAIDGPSSSLDLVGAIFLNATVVCNNGGKINIDGPNTSSTQNIILGNANVFINSAKWGVADGQLKGAGTIEFDGSTASDSIILSGHPSMIAPGITVSSGTQGGTITSNSGILQGTIDSHTAGKDITLGILTIASTGTIQAINGATLHSTNASLANSGKIYAGAGSVISMAGLAMTSSAQLKVDLSSPAAFSQISITGNAAAGLGGSLLLAPAAGFTPNLGDAYIFVTSASGIQGRFTTITTTAFSLAQNEALAVTYSATAVTATVAYAGDSNLDGRIDLIDLQAVANHWQQPTSDWTLGDFDGNGVVDLHDLQAVANNWQKGIIGNSPSLTLLPAFESAASTPEPNSLLLFAAAGLSLRRRK